MIDVLTNKRLIVPPHAKGPSMFIIAEDRAKEICAVLDEQQVRYELSDIIMEEEGEPTTTTIYLSRYTDPDLVQRLLDELP